MTSPPSLEFLDLQAAIAGRYSLEREIGRGGMGVVFLARDVALERPVAIKLLQRHLAQDPTQRERFLREARTAAQLMHPNIVPIHSVEAHDDLVFFVMAFVDGETLTQRVQRKGLLSGGNATRVMQEVAWALGYAHGRGVIHRDIKPDNILLEHASGRAMVADFGIAQVATRDTLSVDGAFVGTVQYMSPEQADATILDARTDIYSLGATIYFALTGASPVEAPTMPAMLKRLMTDEPPSVGTTRPELQPVLVQAVARALSKDRESRFHSADALASALQEASATVRAVRPEVRAFLREVTAAQVVLTAGLGTLVFGAAYSGGTYYGGGVFRLPPTDGGERDGMGERAFRFEKFRINDGERSGRESRGVLDEVQADAAGPDEGQVQSGERGGGFDTRADEARQARVERRQCSADRARFNFAQ